jgi:hypothetical protein
VIRRLREELGAKALFTMQGDYGAQECRYKGCDMQFYKKWGIKFGEALKYVEVQGDGMREIPIKSNTPTFVAIWAARSPDVCIGMQADAESGDFRDGLRKVFVDCDARPLPRAPVRAGALFFPECRARV